MKNTILSKKGRLIGIVFVAIILIYNLPNILSFIYTPDGYVFTGQAYLFNPWDINVYVSAINWAQTHGFEYQNAYTTLSHKSVILYPLYTLVGALFPKVNSFSIYYILIVLTSLVFLFSLQKAIKVFNLSGINSLFLVTLISFAGGFGWLTINHFYLPDIGLTPFTFSEIFQKPHEALAVSFYIFALSKFYLELKSESKSKFGLTTIVLAVSGFTMFYPYHLLSFYLIIILFGSYYTLKYIDKKTVIFVTKTIFYSLPFGTIYSLYLLSGGGFGSVFSPPNLPSPDILHLVLGYGIFTPLVLYRVYCIKKMKLKDVDDKEIFLFTWLFASMFLAYLPFNVSKYFLRGLFLPLTLIASKTVFGLCRMRPNQALRKVLLSVFFVFGTLSGIAVFLVRLESAKMKSPWTYLTIQEKQVIDFLNQSTNVGSGVLAPYPLSNHIPAHTNNRVYFGHLFQTPDSLQKHEEQTNIFNNVYSELQRDKFLLENNLEYIITNNLTVSPVQK